MRRPRRPRRRCRRAATPNGPNDDGRALSRTAAAATQPSPTQPALAKGLPATDSTARAGVETQAAQAAAAGTPAGYTYPAASLPRHVRPGTPIPEGLRFNEALLATADAERGRALYSGQSCIGCHYINGNPMSAGKIGPNLTHVGSRNTIGAGLFPNDPKTLAYWIKNTRKMKPGVVMPTLGLGEVDPVTKQTVKQGGLTDQQIADIVAYLQALK